MEVVVKVKCKHCKEDSLISVTEKQFKELKKGEKHIQQILPNHSADAREILISGICGTCYDRMFIHG